MCLRIYTGSSVSPAGVVASPYLSESVLFHHCQSMLYTSPNNTLKYNNYCTIGILLIMPIMVSILYYTSVKRKQRYYYRALCRRPINCRKVGAMQSNSGRPTRARVKTLLRRDCIRHQACTTVNRGGPLGSMTSSYFAHVLPQILHSNGSCSSGLGMA